MAARCFGSYVLGFFLDLCGLSPGGFNEPCTLTMFKSVAEKANIEKLLEIYETNKQKRLRRSASTTED